MRIFEFVHILMFLNAGYACSPPFLQVQIIESERIP